MPTKKKFIDKKNAVTFRLVHRSQRDPLQADERAPKHVLVECTPKENKEAVEKRKEEQRKYGVYFDDDYDYLQHLRDVNTLPEWESIIDRVFIKREECLEASKKDEPQATRLNLPSSVFQSAVEEKEGLLNKAAPVRGPRLDWDPDIVAALDDDFDFDNPELELEDDFVAVANGPGSDEDITEGREGDDEMDDTEEGDDTSYLPSNDEDDDDSLKGAQFTFAEEETKSKFTNYSLSSSVIHRNEGLKTLDEKFEKTIEEYNDDEIGSLSGEDVGGCIGMESDIMKQLVEQFQKKEQPHFFKEIFQQHMEHLGAEAEGETEDDSSDDLIDISIDTTPKEERWDCESVLSTYSNLYNHPKLISEPAKKKTIKVSEKTGLPLNVLAHRGLTKKQLKSLDRETENKDSSEEEVEDGKKSMASRRSIASTVRTKNETSEEKRVRKSAVKQARRERRMEKKANKMAFKLEERRQEQVLQNLRHNLQGVKLL